MLKRFDGQCVRIIDNIGNVYEGICYYNNSEYNEHEYGCSEDSLQILNIIFFEGDINEVKILNDYEGVYGRFSEKFGKVEKMIVNDGIDSIIDVFFSEEDVHIYRLLLCLNEYIDFGYKFSYYDKLIISLNELLKCNKNIKIQNEAKKVLKKITKLNKI